MEPLSVEKARRHLPAILDNAVICARRITQGASGNAPCVHNELVPTSTSDTIR